MRSKTDGLTTVLRPIRIAADNEVPAKTMPIYEYICLDCGARFDALRPMAQADAAIRCTRCKSELTSRTVSVFAAHSSGKVVAGGGGGCSGCSGGSCATCS